MQRSLFLVSDRTGITVETMVHSLLTQFDRVPAQQVSLPFVDSTEKVEAAVLQINEAAEADGMSPLVFSSLIHPEHRDLLRTSRGQVFDFFELLLEPVAEALGQRPRGQPGLSHGMGNQASYDQRLAAVNYSLRYDDAEQLEGLDQADVVLLGVSRSGKTPTCLYLALQFGLHAANYPLTPEDFERGGLPLALKGLGQKLFGLTIAPDRLQRIREERRPGSNYASKNRCRDEIRRAEVLYQTHSIPWLDTTTMSIEEIATAIVHRLGLHRRI
jgi:regulator of PEP synthase PpsR (kinase-PPPase family)